MTGDGYELIGAVGIDRRPILAQKALPLPDFRDLNVPVGLTGLSDGKLCSYRSGVNIGRAIFPRFARLIVVDCCLVLSRKFTTAGSGKKRAPAQRYQRTLHRA